LGEYGFAQKVDSFLYKLSIDINLFKIEIIKWIMDKRGVEKHYILILFGIFLLVFLLVFLEGATRTCYSCSNCSAEIGNSSSGDVIKLSTSISSNGSCIGNPWKSGFTFDCQNYTILGNITGTAISINNLTNGIIRDCVISNFTVGIYSWDVIRNTTLKNLKINTTRGNSTSTAGFGIELLNVYNSTITDITTYSDTVGAYQGGSTWAGIYIFLASNNVTISNVIANNYYLHGIYFFSGINNSYLTNITAQYNGGDGIKLENSFNNTINNSYLSNNYAYGILIDANYTTITNTITNNNRDGGVWVYYDTVGTVIKNLTANNNTNYGGAVSYSSFPSILMNSNNLSNNPEGISGRWILINVSVQENNEKDVDISDCASSSLTNVTGSGNRAIEFYNYSVNLQNKILSELILCDADNSNITNVTIQGSDTKLNNGFYIYESDNTNISNINSSGNYNGIYLSHSNYTILRDVIANNNWQGVYFYEDKGSFIYNSTLQENEFNDIYIYYSIYAEYCPQNLTNVTGSGNRAIEFYNYSVNLQNKILSELILCDADNSNITNVTIQGSDTKLNNGFYLYRTDNITMLNINSSYNYYGLASHYSYNNSLIGIVTNNNSQTGMYIVYTSNNIIKDAVSNNNSLYGAYLYSGFNNNILTNITASYNNFSGIYLYSSNNSLTNITTMYNLQSGVEAAYTSVNNTLTNITASYNNFSGIFLADESLYNILKDSHIENNSQYGIYFLARYYSLYPQYNLIYNNIINNTINYYNSTNLTNYFNTTKTSGTNIIGGSWIGGNYWATPTGTGFSQNPTNCTDIDGDGICDLAYSLDGLNYDYLPLTTDLMNPDISIVYPPNNTNTTNTQINVNYSVSDNIAVSSCWYSNNSGKNNNTLTNCVNITGVRWLQGANNVTIWVNDTSNNLNWSSVTFNVSCVENWDCTDWSTCSGGIQTRTCIDLNSCGTNISKPAESQSCTTEGTPGGGTTPPTEETTITTQTISEITPEQPAEVIIDNPKIDLTKITINVLENVASASITVTKVEPPSEAGLQIGLPAGESYQAFKINATKLNDTNIANVTIDFKVNKTWLEEKNGTIENIRLYRKPSNSTEWTPLTTSFVSQDTEYYYFSSLSPGFSTFIVFYGKYECQPGARRCFNGQSQLCLGNATWLVTEQCPYGCDEQGNCMKIPTQSTIIYFLIVAIISVAIILTSYLIMTKIRKKRR